MTPLQRNLVSLAGGASGVKALDIKRAAHTLKRRPDEVRSAIAQLLAGGFDDPAPAPHNRLDGELASPPAANVQRQVSWSETKSPMTEAADLQKSIDALVAQGTALGRTPTAHSADLFGGPITALWDQLHSPEMKQQVKGDPILAPLHEQLVMNLRHVRMDIDASRYPYDASVAAMKAARDFFTVLGATSAQRVETPGTPGEMQVELEQLKKADSVYSQALINDPMGHYQAFSARLTKLGPNAPFPEFKNVARIVRLEASAATIVELAQKNPRLAALRQLALGSLADVEQRGFPYQDTVDAIQKAVAFFDVHERSRPGGQTPPLYHSRRWQYHAHIMKAEQPKFVLFPTQYSLGVTDLLKIRGVPIGFVGVTTHPIYADGHYQTPLEFWFHDINHSRRMWQQFVDRAQELGLSIADYARQSNDYVWKEILPAVSNVNGETEEQMDIKRLMEVILFEVFHEDALPADKGTLQYSLGRLPFEEGKFLFETLAADEKSIQYARAPNATNEAIVFRKLEGEFYDMAGMRVDGLGSQQVRTRPFVARAAAELNEKLQLGIDPEVIKSNVEDDSGLPLDLRASLIARYEKLPDQTVPPNETAARLDFERTGVHRGPPPFFVK